MYYYRSKFGIGKEVAKQISKLKMYDNLALISRRKDGLDDVMQYVETTSTRVLGFVQDLEDFDSIPTLVSEIYNQCSSIDCLLNIAGYTDPQPLLTTSIESMRKTYDVNVFAPVVLMRESVRYMRENGGKIVNVASTAGIGSRPGWMAYSSSKAALISISKTLSDELAEYGISVYCVSPGRCATPLRRKLAPDEDQSTIMQPSHVAGVITRLLSMEEMLLDGQNIIVRKE